MPDTSFDFAVGRTNPETVPVARLQQAAQDAIANEYAELTDYHGKLGHPGLRAAMARRESEREGVVVDPEQVSLMNGSMQAVTLVGEALTQPGDTVICEEFTYSGTIGAYRSLGIDMVGLPVDDDGMRVDLLETKLVELGEARKPKFIYALTTYQNPTGVNLSLARRRLLIDIAERHDIPVVEDNCYGDVHFDGDKPPALYALSDFGKIVYLCSLSKILAPGLRLGYLHAKPPLFDTILARRHDAGGNYKDLAASIIAELYKDGVWALTEELNESLKIKKNLVVDGLAEVGSDVCVRIPDGFVALQSARRPVRLGPVPGGRRPGKARAARRRAELPLRAGCELPHPRGRTCPTSVLPSGTCPTTSSVPGCRSFGTSPTSGSARTPMGCSTRSARW